MFAARIAASAPVPPEDQDPHAQTNAVLFGLCTAVAGVMLFDASKAKPRCFQVCMTNQVFPVISPARCNAGVCSGALVGHVL